MTTTYIFTTTTTGAHSTADFPPAAAATTVTITANPAVENHESQYHVCDGCMHVKTASALSIALYIFGYFVLMIYQFSAAANAGDHSLGRMVYVPFGLTALFLIFAIVSAVYLNKAFSKKDVKHMNLVLTFVFCSIFYLLYLSIATLLAYTSEGEWIDYMRVQVESGPRSSQGLPKDNGSWKAYRRERITGRCFTLFGIFLISLMGACYSFAVIEACVSYITEQASGSRPVQAASTANDPLINRGGSDHPTTTTTFEMRTATNSTAGATPMMFNFANWDNRQDSSGSAPPPSYEDVTKRK